MVNIKSHAMFDELEAQLDATYPASVPDYYNKNKNWRSVRHEWFTTPQFLINSLNIMTNNHLEAINGKLKSASVHIVYLPFVPQRPHMRTKHISELLLF